MYKFKQLCAAHIILILFTTFAADSQNLILANAYAHNDYWHKRPLLDALDNGFIYVEADVFLKKNKLVVAHNFLSKKNRTLEDLYLKPLSKYVEDHQKINIGVNNTSINIMIDIKSKANSTYKALAILLNKYKYILSGYENGKIVLRNVTVILTGHKPKEILLKNENRLIFMDDNLKDLGKDSCNFLYKTASCKYSDLVDWNGRGPMPDPDRQRLEYCVKQAHKQGRKVRLWGSPENKVVWAELLKCNVDLINTDKLSALRTFLISELSLKSNKNKDSVLIQ